MGKTNAKNKPFTMLSALCLNGLQLAFNNISDVLPESHFQTEMKHLESHEKLMEMCQEGVGGLHFQRGSFFGCK